jgi:hypothetical protein
MKISKVLFAFAAVAAVAAPTAAYAMPEQVSRGNYYDHLPHVNEIWANNGVCLHSAMALSPFCLAHAEV